MPKFSIIIPAYNCQSVICECLDSVTCQNLTDIEVIVVDDGSSDNSAKVVEKYAQEHPIVKMIRSAHHGLSFTRNVGIKQSSGDYIIFLDADDTLDPNAFKTINKKMADDIDVMVYGVSIDYVDEKYSVKLSTEEKRYKKEEVAFAIKDLFSNDLFNYAWNKVYKREIIESLIFKDDCPQGEDFQFNIEVFEKRPIVYTIDNVLYHYTKYDRETLVTKFVPNYGDILEKKNNMLVGLVSKINGRHVLRSVVDNYMLLEYEVFVINMFKAGSTYTKTERINEINKYILNDVAMNHIENGQPINEYGKIFKKVCLSKSAKRINNTYFSLTKVKNTFKGIYFLFRKHVNKKG